STLSLNLRGRFAQNPLCGTPRRRPPQDRPMPYRAPVADIAFALKHAARFAQARADGVYDLDDDVLDAVLEEAGKFASDVIAPLIRVGDLHGTPCRDGKVTTPPGWKDAYTSWAAAGWN